MLEHVLEIVFNLAGGLLEIIFDAYFGDVSIPDSTAGRIVMGIVVMILGGIIWWELR